MDDEMKRLEEELSSLSEEEKEMLLAFVLSLKNKNNVDLAQPSASETKGSERGLLYG